MEEYSKLKNSHYELIDYLKGISIIAIVLMHLITGNMNMLPDIVKKMSSLGGCGVHVFFFCSGFGLYMSHTKKRKTYMEFIKKRFLKIYLPYILVVLISFFVPITYTGDDRIGALSSHIFLYKMFIEKYINSFGPFWFISTIIQFYFLFIPLCHIKEKLGTKKFLFLGFVVSFTYWTCLAAFQRYDNRVWTSFFTEYMFVFSLGMCFTDIIKQCQKVEFNKSFCLVSSIIALSAGGVMTLNGGFIKAYNDIFAFLGFGNLALFLYQISFLKRFVMFISSISYEMYLLHYLVFKLIFLCHPVTLIQQIFVAIIALAVSVVVAKSYAVLLKKINIQRKA